MCLSTYRSSCWLERQIPCNIMHLVTGDSGTALCEVELIGSSDARRRI
jgi:hypothetical protein